MKALVGTFNQEKALVGVFSVIVQPVVEPMDRFAALIMIKIVVKLLMAIFQLRVCRPMMEGNVQDYLFADDQEHTDNGSH